MILYDIYRAFARETTKCKRIRFDYEHRIFNRDIAKCTFDIEALKFILAHGLPRINFKIAYQMVIKVTKE